MKKSVRLQSGAVGKLSGRCRHGPRLFEPRKNLLQERFVENDFATEDDIKNGYTKLYKTKLRLAQWTEDGYIAYVWRNDGPRLKIRGFIA